MITLSYPNFDTLIPTLNSIDFFVIGEIHGIAENARIMQAMLNVSLRTNRSITLAFEWLLRESELTELRKYINGGKNPTQMPAFFLDSDGRVTSAHLQLLEYIRTVNKQKLKEIFITTFDNTESDYEINMAKNLREQKRQKSELVLVETGVIHAQRIKKENQPNSLVSYLEEDFLVKNAFVRYKNGQVQVEDKIYPVIKAEQQIIGPNNLFDYEFILPEATPEKPRALLTDLKMFYNMSL